MKRTIAMILVLMLAMSAIFATTAFAEVIDYDLARDYGITQIPEPIELSEEEEIRMKEEILASEDNNLTVDDVGLEYFGTTSYGSKIVRFYVNPILEFFWMPPPHIIGKYIYKYSSERADDYVLLFKNNRLYDIDGAYTNGVINDDELDEIAQILNFEVYDPNRNATVPATDETAETNPTDNIKALNEEKIYCEATLEDDFADDSVLVTLTNEASLKLKNYTAEDFGEIGAVSVQDLTGNTVEKLREQQAAASSPDEWIDASDFRQVLVIYLNTKSKQNVLDAIRKLETRDDVYAAEPDYIAYADDFHSVNDETSETEPISSNKKPTSDTTQDNNSNGAIPTGGGNTAVFVLLLTAAVAGLGTYFLNSGKSNKRQD